MKKQIKELRVQIDGLAQLVKTLGQPPVIVSKENISDDISEELLKMVRDSPIAIMKLTDAKPIGHSSFNYNLYECHKSLRLAKAWLGKILEELGEETPYKNDGKRKDVKDIEPTADKSAKVMFGRDMSYIEKIDLLREEIKEIKQDLNDFSINLDFCDYDEKIELVQNYLTEARFHLGFELQIIKEQEESK